MSTTSAASTVDPNDVASHAESVRALARRLVRDGGTAEDIAQEAWLVALRRPRRSDVPLSWWLARVVRNVAGHVRRDEGTRRRHEQSVTLARDAESADALVERTEIHHRLVGAVLALEEPYRATILMRYFEDLSAAEIARRAGVPAATVRSRLKRGLDMLRARLDAGHDGDRRAWAVLLAPVSWEGRARSGVPSAVTIAACALVAVGVGIAMMHSRSIGGDSDEGTTASVRGSEGTTAPAFGREGRNRARLNDGEASTSADETPAAPEPVAAANATDADGPTGVSIEVFDEDGRRIPQCEVVLGVTDFSMRTAALRLESWTSFIDVARSRPLTGPGPLVIGNYPKAWEGVAATAFARVPGFPPTDLERFTIHAGNLAAVRLIATRPRSLAVRVVDRTTDLPVANASVVSTTELERRGIRAKSVRGTNSPGSATTGADGRCRVEGLGRGDRAFDVDAAGFIRGHADSTTEGELVVRLEPQRGGGEVTVRAFGEDGRPIVGLGVCLAGTDRTVRTDPAGKAVFTNVVPGLAFFSVDTDEVAAGSDLADAMLRDGTYFGAVDQVEAGGTYEVTLGVTRSGTASVDVRCVGEDGLPLSGMTVELAGGNGAKTVTDESGNARLTGLEPGTYCPHVEVAPNAGYWYSGESITLTRGSYLAKTLTLGSNTVRGRVVAGPDRHGVAGVQVWIDNGVVGTDANGRFELRHARSGTIEVSAVADGLGARRTGVTVPADGDIVLELVAYGRVAVRFAETDRQRLRNATFRMYRADGDSNGDDLVVGAGDEDLVSMWKLPGRYDIRVGLDGRTRDYPVEVTSYETTVVEVRAP